MMMKGQFRIKRYSHWLSITVTDLLTYIKYFQRNDSNKVTLQKGIVYYVL
jgi:hypothetical protein